MPRMQHYLKLSALIAILAMAGSSHAATAIFNGSGSPSIDDTVALQTAVNNMSSGDVLFIQGTSRISTIVISNRVGLTLQLNGVISSIFTSSPSTGGFASSPSKNPLFEVDGGSSFTFISSPGGYLRNGYGEAVSAQGVNGLQLSVNISGAGVGSWDGLYLNGNSNVVISNSYIRKSSALSTTPEDDLGSMGAGHGIKLFANSHVLISNMSISEVRGNGIHLGSGYDPAVVDGSANHYQNTVIQGNKISMNGYSGIQVAFNNAAEPTKDFTISDNSLWNNYADGIDMNNTSTPYSAWGLVTNNRLYHNGYINDTGTPHDGSGVATVIGANQIILSNNLAIDPNATGLYVSISSDVQFLNNVVIKTPGTLNELADAECGHSGQTCSNVSFSGNDLYWSSTNGTIGLRAFTQASSTVAWANEYVASGSIQWVYGDGGTSYTATATPGVAIPSPAAGLSISNTDALNRSFFRWTAGSNGNPLASGDFIIAYANNKVTPAIRLVAWTAGSPHSITINLGQDVSPSDPNELIIETAIDGSSTIPSPRLSNNTLTLLMSNSPVFADIP